MAIEVKMTKMFKLEAGLVIHYWEGDFDIKVAIQSVDLREVCFTVQVDRTLGGPHTVSYLDFLDEYADKVDGLTQYESKVV